MTRFGDRLFGWSRPFICFTAIFAWLCLSSIRFWGFFAVTQVNQTLGNRFLWRFGLFGHKGTTLRLKKRLKSSTANIWCLLWITIVSQNVFLPPQLSSFKKKQVKRFYSGFRNHNPFVFFTHSLSSAKIKRDAWPSTDCVCVLCHWTIRATFECFKIAAAHRFTPTPVHGEVLVAPHSTPTVSDTEEPHTENKQKAIRNVLLCALKRFSLLYFIYEIFSFADGAHGGWKKKNSICLLFLTALVDKEAVNRFFQVCGFFIASSRYPNKPPSATSNDFSWNHCCQCAFFFLFCSSIAFAPNCCT